MTLRVVLLGAGLAGAIAAPAVAQEPGVHYDRDSPAGKQYAVPLDAARDVGDESGPGDSPAGGGNGSGSARSGLFGAGVRPAAGSGPGTKSPGAPGGPADPTGTPGRSQPRSEQGANDGGGAIRTVAAGAASEQSRLAVGLVLLAVLAAALAGVGIRRSRRTVS